MIINEQDERLLKRFTAIKKMNYFIEESVYYRTHSEDLLVSNKKILWNPQLGINSTRLYEDRS
jgi:hypothetical protein